MTTEPVNKKYKMDIGLPLIPLFKTDGQQDPDGYEPPDGAAVRFRTILGAEHDGETVNLIGGFNEGHGIKIVPAFFINGERRQIFFYNEVVGWQVRKPTSPYDTDLLQILKSPYQHGPKDFDYSSIPQIGKSNALIPLARKDGSYWYNGCFPPRGLSSATFITHDGVIHTGEVITVRGGRHQYTSDVVFLERIEHIRYIYFTEQVAAWQGETSGNYDTNL